MSNVGQHIVAAQNEQPSIMMLAGQRFLYSKAKNLFYIQCIVAVPIPIIISVLTTVFKTQTEPLTWIFSFYTILAAVSEFLLDNVIFNLKSQAAAIQDKFDRAVLLIPSNQHLVTDEPTSESIFRNYNNYIRKHNTANLIDWYSTFVNILPTNIATLICQRTNCTYDFSLRKRVFSFFTIIAVTTSVILFILSASSGLTLQSFLIEVAAPSIPVIVLWAKLTKQNTESVKNLAILKDQIEHILYSATRTSIVEPIILRQVQDKIYLNRINSNLMPDWIFKRLRRGLENEMHFAVQDKIREINTR